MRAPADVSLNETHVVRPALTAKCPPASFAPRRVVTAPKPVHGTAVVHRTSTRIFSPAKLALPATTAMCGTALTTNAGSVVKLTSATPRLVAVPTAFSPFVVTM